MSSEKPFYVYVHRKATDGSVFYVDKGKGNRAFDKTGRNAYWHRIVNKHGFKSDIVIRFEHEECAFSFEIALIKMHGRKNLCNASNGGEGPSGLIHTIESKAKMSAARIGKKKSKESIEKTASSHRGRKRSQETRDRISEAQRGVKLPPRTDEFKKFISILMTGRVKSEDEKIKMSERNSKPVETECGKTFKNANHACEWIHVNGWPKANQSAISSCARGVKQQAYGYKWKYINDPS